TDDDWNENERIEDEDRRRGRVDIIGPAGSPDNGFKIDNPINNNRKIDFDILAGSFYLGGLRLEMEKKETFLTQKDWLQQPDNLNQIPAAGPGVSERFDLVYLEAWRQPVSAVEDGELFEVALGGPDTSTRMRSMRRVRVEPGVPDNCIEAMAHLENKWETENKGILNEQNERIPGVTLTVGFSDDGDPADLCSPAVAAGYLGAENQALRVQLTGRSRFTWGFDNASPLYRVEVAGGDVTMLTLPKDQAHWPLSGQVVEILPRSAVLPNGEKTAEIQGEFFTVQASYNPDDGKFTLNGTLPADFGKEGEYIPGYLYMRVRNRGSDKTSDPEISFTPGGDAVALGNTGLTVSFYGEDHVAGDYWIIAARPETPQEVVPWKLELEKVPPIGIRRFYAPLAVIKWTFSGTWTGEVVHHCRDTFKPLTQLEGRETCCTVTVGDGTTSIGDYPSLKEALGAAELEHGGRVCMLRGVHRANVVISRRDNIQVTGCGENTIIHPDPDSSSAPVFLIENSRNIRLENMTLVTVTGTAVQVKDSTGKNDSKGISIMDNRIIAGEHAVDIRVDNDKAGGNAVRICGNQIGMLDKRGGQAAVSCSADDVFISGNRIVTAPGIAADDLYTEKLIRSLVEKTFLYVSSAADFLPKVTYTRGGIRVYGGSDHIKITGNVIIGGIGSGISLELEKDGGALIYEMAIDGNTIRSMRFNGIGPSGYKNVNIENVPIVENLTISRNIIEHCAWFGEGSLGGGAAIGGIVLAACENALIQDNRIENNGESYEYPVCGIYVIYGENIDIKGNRIVNNGPLVSGVKNPGIRPGKRGGIVIDMCISFNYHDIKNAPVEDVDMENITLAEVIGEFGLPALEVHDNTVIQPLGHAFAVTARGPVSVVNNRFTSRDINSGVGSRTVLAGTVYIFNLGVSQNYPALLNSYSKIFSPDMKLSDTTPMNDMSAAYINAYLGTYCSDGNVLFSNNQTTLELRGKETAMGFPFEFDFALSSVFIFSMDDVGFMGNQSDCNFSIDLLFTNTAIFGVSVRTCNNRFKEGLIYSLFSLVSAALANAVTFNQATHCIYTQGSKELLEETGNIVLAGKSCKEYSSMLDKFFKFQ
ncbi:MAG: right-handed parallel beta-helix repeat-containing protein, partial [bacterium]|nr:right-handed parallel beta-helix repeat-containing protein [bacterium]